MIKVIKFGASWCGPCKMLDPILKELKDEMIDVEFQFVDVEEDPETTANFGVMGVPRTMIYKNDERVEDFAGFKPKSEIYELINKHI